MTQPRSGLRAGAIGDDLPMTPARAALLALAVVACTWFAIGIRQVNDTQDATAIVTGAATPSPAAAVHARSLLQAAGWLNPDQLVPLLRGRLALIEGDNAGALRTFESVARSEPQNLEAWVAITRASTPHTLKQLHVALLQIGRLDPRVK